MWRAPQRLIEVTGHHSYAPFPGEPRNGRPADTTEGLNTPRGIAVDGKDRLWVIDPGNQRAHPQLPKLVAFDITTRELNYRFNFTSKIAPPEQLLQDLAVDAWRGVVFIADCGPSPALVMVDTNNNTARRFSSHPALAAGLVRATGAGMRRGTTGKRRTMAHVRGGISSITLSADGETLYFGARNGGTWYAVPTRLFRANAADATIRAAIKRVGPKPLSDSASTDAEDNHFFTNLTDNGIDVLSRRGTLRPFIRDQRLASPDNLQFGPGAWLYVTVNQLSDRSILHASAQPEAPSYLIARVWTGTHGAPPR